ncbi:MAG: hypothetical protein ABSE73_00010 [Planctomycetota bacterium]
MATKTKACKPSATAQDQQAEVPPPPEPAEITGQDLKRVALCTNNSPQRWTLNYIELSPLGLAATNGRLLCVLNAPGWPYQCYLEPRSLKGVPNDAKLAINGAVQFVGRGQTMMVVPHENPDQVTFPKWQSILPEACNMQPLATLNASLLRTLVSALLRTPDSSLTLYAKPDDCLSPVMLVNEAGDLGLMMPVMQDEGREPLCYFPTTVYQALRLDTKTLPAVFIPRTPKVMPAPSANGPAPTSSSGNGGGSLLG